MARRHSGKTIASLTMVLLLGAHHHAFASEPDGARMAPRAQRPIEVTFYPLLVRVPIFGASIDVPDLPSSPGSGGTESTDVSLNGAYMFGGIVESPRWFVDTNGLWAAVSASRSAPFLNVDSDTRFFNLTGGIGILDHWFVTVGVRRVGTTLDVQFTAPSKTEPVAARATPGVWDPLVGAEYRNRFGSHIRVDADVKGGGFGIGSDVDLSGEVAVNWRFASHFEVRGGYSIIYFKITAADATVDGVQRTLVAKQTLHGPEFGIAIPF
jgi:hypothetical protein